MKDYICVKLENYEKLLKLREEQFKEIFGSLDADPCIQIELNRIKNIIADIKEDIAKYRPYNDEY